MSPERPSNLPFDAGEVSTPRGVPTPPSPPRTPPSYPVSPTYSLSPLDSDLFPTTNKVERVAYKSFQATPPVTVRPEHELKLDVAQQQMAAAGKEMADAVIDSKYKALANIVGSYKDRILVVLRGEDARSQSKGDVLARETLQGHIDQLIDLMTPPVPATPEERNTKNQQFIFKLREALTSATYEKCKGNPNYPWVNFLHKCAVAIYTDVHSSNASYMMGKKFLAATKEVLGETESPPISPALSLTSPVSSASSVSSTSSTASIASTVSRTHTVAAHVLHTDHAGKGRKAGRLQYLWDHIEQARASLAAQFRVTSLIYRFLAFIGLIKPYDSHTLNLANNPSVDSDFTTKIQHKGQEKTAVTCNIYMGSPTVGDEVAPEFRAMLQAIADNSKLPADQRDPSIPDCFQYVNLQNISDPGGEGSRSEAIMNLNKEFPGVFIGYSLPKDSDFYQQKGTEANKPWESAADFGQQMQSKMLAPESFSLENRSEKGDSGFYFPTNVFAKEEWKHIIGSVIARADARFRLWGTNKTGEEAFKLKAAYQEYVYTMLEMAVQQKTHVKLMDKGIDNPRLVYTSPCKEMIDRGSTELAKIKHYNADLPPGADKEAYMAGAIHQRAISTRDRTVLNYRIQYFLALVDTVSVNDFQGDLQAIYESMEMGVRKDSFRAAEHVTKDENFVKNYTAQLQTPLQLGTIQEQVKKDVPRMRYTLQGKSISPAADEEDRDAVAKQAVSTLTEFFQQATGYNPEKTGQLLDMCHQGVMAPYTKQVMEEFSDKNKQLLNKTPDRNDLFISLSIEKLADGKIRIIASFDMGLGVIGDTGFTAESIVHCNTTVMVDPKADPLTGSAVMSYLEDPLH